MTVRELLAELQHLPRDLKVLAFEAGCEDYCERRSTIIWGRREDLQHVRHECLTGRVLPGGRGYLPCSSTRIPGALLVQRVLLLDSRRGVLDGAGRRPARRDRGPGWELRARTTSRLPGHHQ